MCDCACTPESILQKERTFRSSELQVCQFGEVLNLGANRRRYISAALPRCLTARSNSLCPASATALFCVESISTSIEETSADSCKRKTIDHLDHLNLVLVCSVYAKVLKQVVRITRSRIHIKIHVKISLKTRAPKARAKKFGVSLSSQVLKNPQKTELGAKYAPNPYQNPCEKPQTAESISQSM